VTSQTAAAPARLDGALVRARRWWRIASEVRPAYVLGVLVGIEWVAVLALALTVRHNGWLYYAGGDQLWHYSGAYLLAHGHLPPSYVGYGWSFLLLPIAAIAGPNLVSALPALIVLNTVVLLPLELFCIYGIAARIAGRMFGYFATLVFVLAPFLGIVFVEQGYHQKYTELTLPQLLGLTSVPDFPSTVALVVSAYLCLRALETRGWQAGALAGLAAGYSIGIKPSNAIFLVAPALLFLVERRRELFTFAAGLAPALLTLAVWKYRGLGQLAAAPAPETIRLASGPGGLLRRIYSPKESSWAHLHQVLLGLREHFWISRVIEWLPVGGLVALVLRSRRGFLLVGSWFVVYLLVKGTYIPASVDDASIWRILMPAFPAYLLLAASVPLLVPGVRVRPAPAPASFGGRRLGLGVAAAFVVFAALPLGVLAAVPRLHDGGRLAVRFDQMTLVPVSGAPHLQASAHGNTVRLTWRDTSPSTATSFFRVLRTKNSSTGVACAGRLNGSSDNCELFMDTVSTTRATTVTDHPGPGTWTYRIGISANWVNDPTLGDVYVVSTPATVSAG
jgi:Dolichyl-phosphate-mannose-protein mannosyltransferase